VIYFPAIPAIPAVNWPAFRLQKTIVTNTVEDFVRLLSSAYDFCGYDPPQRGEGQCSFLQSGYGPRNVGPPEKSEAAFFSALMLKR
jgi:hypothetical protein